MNNFYFKRWLLIVSVFMVTFCVSNTLNAQTLISGIKAATPFLTTGTNVTAALTKGKGILQAPTAPRGTITFGSLAPRGFAADGVTATIDTANNKGEYIQYAISPAAGFDLNITGLSLMGNGTVLNTTNHYAVAIALGDSTIFSKGGATFLDSAGKTGNLVYTTAGYLASGADTVGQKISVLNGSIVYLRIYIWGAAARTNASQFTITRFILSGTATASKATSSTTNASICFGGSYLFNKTQYTSTGTYTYHTLNSVGADSSAILNLTVGAAPTTNSISLTGCKSVIYKGLTYTTSTVFVDTVKNLVGCDSLYTTVNITMDCTPLFTSFTPNLAALGDTVVLTGKNFTGATSVTFGGIKALSFSVVNDTTIKALVDTGASGSIAIITPNGTVSLAGFVFNSASIITGIKTTTPFITPGKNVIAAISQGVGILRAPAAPQKQITFGSRAAGGFAADGVTATFDTANKKGEYVQFEVSPANGYDLNISGITLRGNGTIANATNFYAVAMANGDTSLFNNGGATFLDSAGVTGNILYRTNSYLVSGADTIGQNIKVTNGNTLYLRVYLWRAAVNTNNSVFTITNFAINGKIVAGSPKPTSSTTTASICYGGSYLFNDSLYTTAGTYTIHKTNSVGADSAATLKLSVGVAPKTNAPISLTGCKSVTYKGIVYTAATVLVDTAKNLAGCDSIFTTVNITMDCSPLFTSFTPSFAAYADTVVLIGKNFTGATSVIFGGVKALGFSVVNDTTIKALVDSGASGDISVVTPNGTISLAGFVFNSAAIISGIKTTNPFITPGKFVTSAISQGSGILRAPAAPQKQITFGTRAAGGFAADGVTATFDTANKKGEYVQFEVKPASGYDLNISGITLKGNGTLASTTNYYAVAYAVGDTNLFNTGGATFLDSAGVTGNILYRTNSYLVSGADTIGQSINVSNGLTMYLRVYMWGAAARTNNSVFTITNFAINGSASVTVSKATTSTTNATICSGGTYLFNGTTCTKAGTYTYITKNSVGADSIATLILSVGAAPRNGRPVTVTGCNSVVYNNITYTTPATVIDTLKNSNGCDSLYTTVTIAINCNPTITSLSSTVGLKGDSITIIGTNFTAASAVAFGGTAAASFAVVNDTTIKAVVGTGASGSVTVTTANGIATLAGFTFSTAAVITGIKATTPFINAGNHITAAISRGAGITQAPAARGTTIIFGTKPVGGVGGAAGFAADGIAATVDTALAKGEYVQFTVSPATGYNLNVSGITLKGRGTIANTTNHYAVAIAVGDSTLFNSGNALYIDSAGKAGNVLNTTVGFLASGADTASQSIIVKNGSAVYLRVYLWNTAATTNNSQFTISNFLVDGATTPIPTSTTYDTICAGSSVLFNGTSYTKSGTYTVHFTNAVGFDSAAILVLTVNPLVTPSVKVTSTASVINVGDTVKFTATASNAGTSPGYQWLKNHSVIWGANTSTYSTNSLFNGDSIFVALFAGKGCYTVDTVLSGIVVTKVNVAISGTVKNPLGTIIPSVTVAVNGTNSVVTDSLGKFGFTVTQGSNNVLIPTKINDVNKANGINGTDISLIQSHILKKVLLNSPYKLIAGDVNNDGAVNGTDIALIKSFILKHITTFSGNRLWAFVDSSFAFTTPTKPFPYNDSISLTSLATNKTGQNFIGVKLGDVNYDWNASILANQTAQAPIELSSGRTIVDNSATEVRIPVSVKNFKNIMGMQYTLNFNSKVLELKSIENNLIDVNYNTDYAADGKLPFLWVDPSSTPQTLSDNTVLFELVFNKKGNLSNEDITLSSDITSVNAFDGNYATVGILKVAGSITESNNTTSQLRLYPNPIKDNAVINGKHISKVQVVDNAGKVLMVKTFSDATNPSLNVANLAAGTYRLQVLTSDNKVTTVNMLKR